MQGRHAVIQGTNIIMLNKVEFFQDTIHGMFCQPLHTGILNKMKLDRLTGARQVLETNLNVEVGRMTCKDISKLILQVLFTPEECFPEISQHDICEEI